MHRYLAALRDRRRAFALLAYAATAAASVALSLWVQAPGNFPDPDSFYHGRMAILIAEHGPVHDFPWLADTVFADSYVDHHFLYHVLLVPFVETLPLAAALRLSSIVFAAIAVVAGALLLRGLGFGPISFLAPGLFLASNPLLFRLNLAKTPSLSLVALFLGTYAALKRRPLLLGFVAFLYVWLYDGWFILLFAVATVVIADVLVPERAGTETDARGWHWRHRLLAPRNLRIVGASLAGVVLGHLVNPYFPENLAFEWLHIVRIGFVGFSGTIPVGAEWYPYDPFELLAATSTTFLALLAGGTAFAVSLIRARKGAELPRPQAVATVCFWIFAAVALVFAIRSKRNVEYFVPFAVFASVASADLFLMVRGWEELRTRRPVVGRVAAAIVASYLAVVVGLLFYRDWNGVRNDFANGVPATKYAGLSAWLDANTPEGSLVFHDDWDDPPYFWIDGTHDRFLVALDPTFMYVKDKALYEEWVGITRSTISDRLSERIRDDFGADYAFVDAEHPALRAAFDADPGMRLLYSDREGAIYSVR